MPIAGGHLPHHTPEYVAKHLRYDSKIGDLWWLIARQGRQLDRPAGTTHTTGTTRSQTVRSITLDGRRYYAHVLAWVLMKREWPDREVDHEDQNPLNNRWSNLRLGTRSQQNMNQTPKRPGLTGASFYKRTGRWQSYIKKDGKWIGLGYFDTAEEAHEEYKKAAVRLFGEFAHSSIKNKP